MRPAPIGPSAALLALALLAPAIGQAQNLDNCTPGLAGWLPLGPPDARAAEWKSHLYEWIAQGQPGDFAWSANPPTFQSPVAAFGAGYQPNGNNCVFAPGFVDTPPWAGVGAAEELQIEQFWLLNAEYSGLAYSFLNHAPDIYTLGGMEDWSTCTARTPALAWGNGLAWLADWEYPGNPFGPGQPEHMALVNRLSAWMSEQLIMLDWAHYDSAGLPLGTPVIAGNWEHPLPSNGFGAAANGAELSAQLGLMAWTYLHIEADLQDWVKHAMKQAFEMYAERVWFWNPYHPQSNRGIRSVPALYYVWQATGSPDVDTWYQDVQAQFFDASGGNWVESGYWHDDYAFDLGYNGSNMMVAMRAVEADPNAQPFVYDSTAITFDMTAHLATEDVDGRWTSPNVFNSRTSNGAIYATATSPRSGYYGGLHRFLPALEQNMPWAYAAMRDLPTLGPQASNNLDPRDPDFHENLACRSQGYANFMNAAVATSPQTLTVTAQGDTEWPHMTRSQDFGLPPVDLEHHQLGDFVDWWDNAQATPELELMPTELDGPYVRNFADRFVFAKFGSPGAVNNSAAVLHLGETALGSFGESGFGGGQLVSYWSEFTGPSVHARRKGRNTGTVAGDDQWADWRTFPMHAVTLQTVSQSAFNPGALGVTSTARITNVSPQVFLVDPAPAGTQVDDALTGSGAWASPATVPESAATAVVARVSGMLPVNGRNATGANGFVTGVLQSSIAYERGFVLADNEVWVRTEVGASAASEQIQEAWESIPLWGRDVAAQSTVAPATVRINSTQGTITTQIGTASQPGISGPFTGVTSVEVDRGNGTTVITFTAPQRVEFGPQWELGNLRSRTLLVDLLPSTCGGSCALVPTSVTYRIEFQ